MLCTGSVSLPTVLQWSLGVFWPGKARPAVRFQMTSAWRHATGGSPAVQSKIDINFLTETRKSIFWALRTAFFACEIHLCPGRYLQKRYSEACGAKARTCWFYPRRLCARYAVKTRFLPARFPSSSALSAAPRSSVSPMEF